MLFSNVTLACYKKLILTLFFDIPVFLMSLIIFLNGNYFIIFFHHMIRLNDKGTLLTTIESFHVLMDISKNEVVQKYFKAKHRNYHRKKNDWWNDELKEKDQNMIISYLNLKNCTSNDQELRQKFKHLKHLFRKTKRQRIQETDKKM
jgi:hypothetical protein